jgi:hypothetical protein
VNVRELFLQVADAFNEVLGHVADEQVEVEASEDSGEEVEEEPVPSEVVAPRDGWVEELCTVDGRGEGADHPHAATHLNRFEGDDPFDYFIHFMPAAFIQGHLLPCINAALAAGAQLSRKQLRFGGTGHLFASGKRAPYATIRPLPAVFVRPMLAFALIAFRNT